MTVVMPVSQNGIEGGRERAGPFADEKPELVDSATEAHHEVANLLADDLRFRGRAGYP
ncbi:hypothetical protein [Kutzneria buriramensis]|uniref:hypothetical protein n=1 Tax=Kutzneria buriramensis TaxID=1045776 RepID=UPI001B87AE43